MDQSDEIKGTPSSLHALPTDEKISPINKFEDYWRHSIEKPEEFWATQARQLDWFRT